MEDASIHGIYILRIVTKGAYKNVQKVASKYPERLTTSSLSAKCLTVATKGFFFYLPRSVSGNHSGHTGIVLQPTMANVFQTISSGIPVSWGLSHMIIHNACSPVA